MANCKSGPCYTRVTVAISMIVYSLCATRLSEEIMNVWTRIPGMSLLELIARKPIDIVSRSFSLIQLHFHAGSN